MVKVGINGYGTVGKRVADAVDQQDDMEIVGVAKRSPTYEAEIAVKKGFPFYAASDKYLDNFEEKEILVEGMLEDLLEEADIIIDGTPKKSGYKSMYEKAGVKAIWQGGEDHELTGLSFNSMANYEEALGADYLRVVSCNTTGLLRTLYPLHRDIGIDNCRAVMVRRGADPWDTSRGPINSINPVLDIPSHHGPDVQSVVPEINIQTTAVKVPTTIMHLHSNIVELEEEVDAEEVIDIWDKTPRVRFFNASQGVDSTAKIMEYAKDRDNTRGDLNEIAVWDDAIKVEGSTLYYYQAIHQESDIIPENIDAIRAMTELEEDPMKSIRRTNEAMGIE
ncbi:MAG: type II glyceraldehyde-3-phosphate dehydrogenase [Candidatus Thermoplasmatota archaeon]|nr:type II glyceraldehyde-3-phosphate dehydrogenase [Candidatus Thermoplasmatota archaeon]MBS3789912.1 type II glyceraldehyde-3-phosphate dehydrogenase [Candidatus Thermoplasmatota archaeon]